jgi:Methyltransferase domain
MNKILQMHVDDESSSCRLCGGATEFRFTDLVLKKYTVRYWRCVDCGSMQTDQPYWLDEAYAVVHSATDTGMVARTLHMTQVTSLLLRLAEVKPQTPCLDWGGGNGLFCRFMRDQGYNFLNHDKYAEPFYCAGFTANRADTANYDVVTSFEVFEHLAEPKRDLAAILELQPKLWIFSTQLYGAQDRHWSYFGPNQGRHVFFYSEQALHEFAAAHGYAFVRGRHLHMFVKRENNPYLPSRYAGAFARHILHGGRLASLGATLNFLARQRHAYLHWQSDSESVKKSGGPSVISQGGP